MQTSDPPPPALIIMGSGVIPFDPRIACGVSTWISNFSEPEASPCDCSTAPSTSIIAEI